MSKRKRDPEKPQMSNGDARKIAKTNGHVDVKSHPRNIQIIAGSYERVLHGITASLPEPGADDPPTIKFADTFLFNAHASAIRSLALSPLPSGVSGELPTVYLATGGSDEKINVYSLAACPVREEGKMPSMPSIGKNVVSENPSNRELGSLLQHSSTVTALHFPSRSKLLSGSEDNTISVSRVRDLEVISTVKAPKPKAPGQASGDSTSYDTIPAGINDFAVHPSMKLMISVGRGEKCMRLWNLVTGKKAGVLNFSKDILQEVKEAKYSSGEGRKIRWSPSGDEFAIAFERGIVVFGQDSKVKRIVLPQPLTKIHQFNYVSSDPDVLAVSTEDGRIVFFSTEVDSGVQSELQTPAGVPHAKAFAQLGGRTAGVTGRIKDFEVLESANHDGSKNCYIVTVSSDGAVKVWQSRSDELAAHGKESKQVGRLIGTYETGNRVTCMKAFIMLPPSEDDGPGLSEFEGDTDGEVVSDSEPE